MNGEALWDLRLWTPRLELRLPDWADWRSPVPVEIVGVEAASPLFGVVPPSS
jgi:hypothetical protein